MMNEEQLQLQQYKTYRAQLSEAQKAQGSKNALDRRLRVKLKAVTRELALAKEHPKVKRLFVQKWQERTRPIIMHSNIDPDIAYRLAINL